MKHFYPLLFFITICIGENVSAATVNINTYRSFTGTATYCQGVTAGVLTASFNNCNSGGGATASTVSITWYYNTTNTIAISGSTQIAQGPTVVSTGTAATVSYTYTPSTATAGTYYYFAVLSSPSNTSCSTKLTTIASTLSTTGTQLITVNALPTVGSNSPICYGTTLNLTTPTVAGATYSWAGPNNFSSVDQNTGVDNVTVATAGTYSVTVTGTGCTGTTTVKINSPAPVVSSNSPVCKGGTLNLTASNISGATYSWTGPNSFTSTSQNPSISPVTLAAAGTYSVTADSSGCTGAPVTTLVVIAPQAGSNSPVCVGNTLNLTATTVAGATYSWTGPNGFTSTSQNPSIAGATVLAIGTYVVTATMGSCVSLPDTTVVFINPTIPSKPTASSNTPVCSGSILNLTASTVTGATYSWTGPGAFTSTLQDPLIADVYAALAGTYSVTATVLGCTSPVATTTVVINTSPATPVASATTNPICAGATLNLKATTIAGVTYSWSGPNSFTSTTQNPSIAAATLAASGIYSVTATSIANGCTGNTGTINAVVNTAAPVASSNSPACSGSTLDLNASFVTGATYAWTGPNGFTSTLQSPTIGAVTATNDGTYSVTATIGGCVSTAATTSVNVVTATAMAYASSAVTQYSGAGITPCPSTLYPILQIAVTVTGNDCPASSITKFIFNTSGDIGSTNPSTDITSASIYYTQQTPGFSNQYFFGSVNTPNGAFTINGTQLLNLGAGTYYFYLCYNVPSTATIGNQIDASMTSFVINGTTETNMTTPSPAGGETIISGSCPSSPDLPNPSANLQTIAAGSLVIPMDNSHQDLWMGRPFNIKAYGLVNALLQQDIPVKWVIKSGKLKDSSDFSANVSLVYPTTGTASLQYFKASEFIVDTTYLNKSYYPGELTATQVMEEFAKTWKVAVYKLTSNTTVDVRYTLHFRPKIALFNNGTYEQVQKKVLDSAGITNYTALSAGLFPGLSACYTFCSEAHWSTGSQAQDSATMRPVWDFVYEGGNFFAQCAGINKYENQMQVNDHFQTTEGITEEGTAATSDVCHYPDMAYTQFQGVVAPRSGTLATFLLPATSAFNPVVYNALTSITGDSIIATSAHLGQSDSVGGNVFYLGGHDYMTSTTTTTAVDSIADIRYINGTRMYLNAMLIPPHRPTPTPLQPGSNVSICQGSSTTLGSSPTGPGGSAVYTWSPSTGLNNSNSANPVASPTVTTTYTVFVNSQGCPYLPASVTVTVVPTPATPIAGGNNPVCLGSTLSLTSTTVTGATYSWTGPNGFTSTLQNPTISGVTSAAAGTYSVTASIGGCPGSPGSITIAVNATPTVSLSAPPTICSGNSTTLTASGATSYTWSPNTNLSATTGTSVSASPTVTTTYSVIGTTGSCPSASQSVVVTVNATPTVSLSAPPTICSGNSTTLTASGATSYTWSPNTNLSATTGASVSASPNTTTTYSVIGTTGSCSSISQSVVVTVNTTPTVSLSAPPTICSGNSTMLTASGATSYTWSPNINLSATTGASVSASPTVTTTYSVIGTTGSCSSASQSVVVTVNTTPTVSLSAPPTICSGNSTLLTASGATSYAWSPNTNLSATTGASVSASPNATTTYSVIGTTGSCPSVSQSVVVTVNTTPTVSLSAPPSICSGNSNTLTASGATSYTWSPNINLSATTGASVSASPNATTTYSVIGTTGSCPSASKSIVVTVNTTPTVSLSAPPTICSGTSTTLTASGATSYTWSPNTNLSATTGASVSASPTVTTTYSVIGTTGSCPSSSQFVVVTVNSTPATPTAGSNTPICLGGSINLTASLVGGATYSWTGPSSFTSPSQNPSIATSVLPDAGTYSVTATVSGCTSAAGTTAIVVNPPPSAPTAGSNSPVCTGTTLNLTANTIANATYSWTGPNTFTSSSQNPSIVSVVPADAGTYSVTATVPGCATSPTGTISVVVNTTPTVTLSAPPSICPGGSTTLTASGATTYAWSPNTNLSATTGASVLASPTVTTTYTVIGTTTGCPSSPQTVVVTVSPIPAVPTASSNSPVCLGGAINLSTSPVGGATYTWTGPNAFTSASQTPSIATSVLADAGTYSVTVTLGGCTSAAGTTSVIVNPPPPAPTAGSNSPVCTGSALNLTASTITSATYSWTGPNSFTSTSQNPSIASSVSADGGTYSVTATVPGCATGPAGTVSVVVNTTPVTPGAGSNAPLCSGSTLNLTSSAVVGATYSWTGPNSFTSSSQFPSLASVTSADSGTYSVTATANGCISPAGTIDVAINDPAIVSAGSNQTVCANNDVISLSGTSNTGSAKWSTSGTGTFSPNNTTLNATYTPSNADTNAGSVTLTLSSLNNGACAPVTNSLTITFTHAPTANAGSNQIVCGNNASVILNGLYTIASGAAWSTSGTGSFSPNNTTMNATYIPSSADTSAGSVTLTLTTTGNGQCKAVGSTMTITISHAPNVNAGSNMSICKNNANVSLSGTSSTGSGTWTTSGTGTFSPNANTLNATYI